MRCSELSDSPKTRPSPSRRMSIKNRYQKYGYPGMSSSISNSSIASSCASEADRRYQSSLSVNEYQSSNGGTLPRTNGIKESNGRSYKSRLEYIVSSMAYIRGELVSFLQIFMSM